jgi:plasmid stability protein
MELIMPSLTIKGLPVDLLQGLRDAASRSHRSLNAEVLVRLQRSVRPTVVDPDRFLEDLAALHATLPPGRPLSRAAIDRAKRSGRP